MTTILRTFIRRLALNTILVMGMVLIIALINMWNLTHTNVDPTMHEHKSPTTFTKHFPNEAGVIQ